MDNENWAWIFGMIIGTLITLFITYTVMNYKRDYLAHIIKHVPEEQVRQAKKTITEEKAHERDLRVNHGG